MRNIKFILLFTTIIMAFSSCYKQDTWIDRNVKEGGHFFPKIQGLSVVNTPDEGFNEGDVVQLALQYWSIDPVKSLNVYAKVGDADEVLDKAHAYVDSFDAEAGAQIQILEYTIPSGASGKDIGLRVEVETDAGLTREKSTSISVN